MKHRARQLLRAAALLAIGTLGASRALADEGPIVVGKVKEVKPFDFAIDDISLRLQGRYTDDQTKSSGGESTHTTQTYFQELLHLETHGHVVHPNFLEFNLAGEVGLTQSLYEIDGQSDEHNGNLHQYLAQATLFRRNSTNLSLLGQRAVTLTHRPFASSLETTTENRAAVVNTRLGGFTSMFRLYQTDQTQNSLTGDEQYQFSEDGFEWESYANIGEHQEIDWRYSYSTLDETSSFSVPNSYETQDARLGHTLRFGEDNRSTLDSVLRYRDQTGSIEQERISLNERLELVHSDTFKTRYSYLYDQFSFQSIEQTTHRATAGFEHRLFKSLVTTGELGLSTQENDDGFARDEQYGKLNFAYDKKVPYGLFTANLFGGYDLQQNTARETIVHAVQEYNFANGDFITLTGQNILPGSITLLGPGGIPLQQDRDWRFVAIQQAQVILQRIRTSPTPEGPVIVEYDLTPGGDTDITTSTLGFAPRYAIKEGPLTGLSVYGRYMVQTQDVGGPGAATVIGNDITDLLYGAEYRIGHFIFNVEQQRHDSTLDPYDALRYSASYIRRVGTDTSLSLSASRTETQYDNLGDVDITYLSAVLDHRLSRNLTARASAGYMIQSDPFDRETTGNEQDLELRWRKRQTYVIAGVRRTELETDDSDNSFLLFYLNIERKFK